MSSKTATIDFGAPAEFGAHLFRVEIPAASRQPVRIVEEYGYRGEIDGIPAEEPRVVLERRIWSQIAEPARQEFNVRLKAAKLRPARWHTGVNKVDRLLGRELCVLAWAAEGASDEALPIICQKWLALRPEERWWLFTKTVAEAGLPEDRERGWRKALRAALADGESCRRPRPRDEDLTGLPLFHELGGEG
ncbi:anti-phage-associated DUF3780 domain-containing protein [Chloroflexus sp.]|uniref:anti-phage-associated DUF3780 domain-containing protein n=1 Tax=Chloroflexus sp. TaxID=1904827 RepID=UPI002ACE1A9B|nr:anti-phage-associated DUF3780 domain-containing protein [Chloroflexus sp.]